MPRVLRRRPVRRPHVALDRGPHPAQAVVVVLHGGPEQGFSTTRTWSAPYVRMLPFARVVRAASDSRIATVRLRHVHTGWNGGEATTLAEARWILGDIAERAPHLPVGLLGHSLGGRTALRAADHPNVVAVVALAPWVPPDEPVDPLAGRSVLVVQGGSDRVCPPGLTREYVDRARAAGVDVRYEELPHVGHAMLRRAATWHRLAADHLVGTLLPSQPAGSDPP